ncbi:type II secretion system F family protein [Nanchangia anserum]|uniref:Type II secretion system F family protein n=1 Tax=Nanchangia anserum TaxID=2692125 RepID=A0A8I0KPB2_9ACTO|nr:type II secretion system F family protein [Nanchangia anserum]MBD3690171.1 type II secretion system F family protein [Nanchangia anserum]QOX82373.1 type II secretion system F family protein [Nanchangia anserum]
MEIIVGLLLGAGCVLIWAWISDPAPRKRPRTNRFRALLDSAELYRVSTWGLVGICALAACASALMLGALTGTLAIAMLAACAAAFTPVALIRARAHRIIARRCAVWPLALDDVVSAIRAGLSLDEALGQLADRGPSELRPHFQAFRADLRAVGRMGLALDRLKARLSDPVADRIIEALRCAHDVGGPDLGVMLSELARMVRLDQRTRGELHARQSWTVNGARLAAVAPWIIVILLCLQPEGATAYATPSGAGVLIIGALVSALAYRIMIACGRLPRPPRTFAPRRSDSHD